MKILVVDDKEDARYLLSALLTGHGHNVRLAANGEEGLRAARAEPPNLIVSDILMPVMDGFRFCREVRGDPVLRESFFIFYTATYTQESDADFARKIGADDFIVKPVEPDIFLARIEAVVEQASRGGAVREPSPMQEAEVLRLYNDRLVAKLEKRSMDLQAELARRQQAEEALRRHAKRLEILRDIDIAILEAHSPDTVATIAVKALRSILLTARTSVATFNLAEGTGTVIAVEDEARRVMHAGDVLPIALFGVLSELQRGVVQRVDNVEAIEAPSEKQRRLLEAGIRSYIAVPLQARGELIGCLNVGFSAPYEVTDDAVQAASELGNQLAVALRQAQLRQDVERQAATLEWDVQEIREAKAKLEQSYQRLSLALSQTVQALAAAVEVRDSYTAGHQRRVTDLALAIGRHIGIDEERLQGIRVAGLMHDIGKLAVPSEILSKPTKLSDVERRLIQEHPEIARGILSAIDFPWPVASIVVQHHERINGSGYPKGLRRDEILPEARILAVADVVEAMSSHRPYRPALGMKAALDEIRNGSGILYDESSVEACIQLLETGEFSFDAS